MRSLNGRACEAVRGARIAVGNTSPVLGAGANSSVSPFFSDWSQMPWLANLLLSQKPQ